MGKSQYKIQFGGLSMGEHQFEFEIKSKFFEQFSESEITEADIQVKANLVKQNSLMHILFAFEGAIKLSCDRCLVDYNCPISGQEKLVIKQDENSGVRWFSFEEALHAIDEPRMRPIYEKLFHRVLEIKRKIK